MSYFTERARDFLGNLFVGFIFSFIFMFVFMLFVNQVWHITIEKDMFIISIVILGVIVTIILDQLAFRDIHKRLKQRWSK